MSLPQGGSLWEMTGKAWVTTFIGAGGKTTSSHMLAQEISIQHPVVLTTTTKVYPVFDKLLWENNMEAPPRTGDSYFWYAAKDPKAGKWTGPDVKAVDSAIAQEQIQTQGNISEGKNRCWVIEGDGARGLKLKCWAIYEPQIPVHTDCAVLILDAGLWEVELKEKNVHRSEYCQDLLGKPFTAENCWRYLFRSPVFSANYAQLNWVIFFNIHNETCCINDVQAKTSKSEELAKVDDLLSKKILAKMEDALLSSQKKPDHLRIAAGNVRENRIRWIDLW